MPADRDEEERPYTLYRARPRLPRLRRARDADGLKAPAATAAPEADPGRPEPPPYEVHRPGREQRRPRVGRIVRIILLALVGWTVLSVLVFLVSAQLQEADTDAAVETALDPAGYTATSPNTVLVLGSDARTEETQEPGSRVGGPSRSDSILLLRVGGGRSARLSIPRDTVVDIPGRGREKVNAAYAYGGPALAVATLKAYLGIEINHLVEVDFANFPRFVDALGGIDYTGGCVISKINGGYANGGYTLRLRRGTHHLDGDQALALARTRTNLCKPSENDLTRVRRQQKILGAIRDQVVSPTTFVRGPLVAWAAPQAIRSDMAGPSLLGLFASVATAGAPATRVLRPSGSVQLPSGGLGLVVSDAERRRAVERFLAG